jgi:hypothetical protein
LTNASVEKGAEIGSPTLAHLLPGRWKALAKTDFLASGRNIFDGDDLTKKVRILLVPFH